MKVKKITLFRIVMLVITLAVLGVIAFCTLPPPGNIPVLMYHIIGDPASDPGSEGNMVSEKALERQMDFLRQFRYRVITMDTYYAIRRGALESQGREVVITFDDGDHSFAEKAAPILAKYKFPVTMFLVSDLIKTGENGSMTADTIKQLQKDHYWLDFESHSKSHPHLLETTDDQLKDELENSKKDLMEILGKPVRDLAYPFGEFDARVMKAAQEAGYRLAFTTGHKRLKEIPEGLHSMTRIKVSRISDCPAGFWYSLSGLHYWVKAIEAKYKQTFRS